MMFTLFYDEKIMGFPTFPPINNNVFAFIYVFLESKNLLYFKIRLEEEYITKLLKINES